MHNVVSSIALSLSLSPSLSLSLSRHLLQNALLDGRQHMLASNVHFIAVIDAIVSFSSSFSLLSSSPR